MICFIRSILVHKTANSIVHGPWFAKSLHWFHVESRGTAGIKSGPSPASGWILLLLHYRRLQCPDPLIHSITAGSGATGTFIHSDFRVPNQWPERVNGSPANNFAYPARMRGEMGYRKWKDKNLAMKTYLGVEEERLQQNIGCGDWVVGGWESCLTFPVSHTLLYCNENHYYSVIPFF